MNLQKFSLTWSMVLVVVTALLATLFPIESARAQAFDPIEVEQAQMVRWQAMADFYKAHDMLNVRFDYEEAAVVQAKRWQAMAEFYQAHDMLNARFDDEEVVTEQAKHRLAATGFDEAHNMMNKPTAVADALSTR